MDLSRAGIHRLERATRLMRKLLIIVLLLGAKSACAQQIELACPAGTTPVPAFTGRNQTTGGIKYNACVDSTGLIGSASVASLTKAISPLDSTYGAKFDAQYVCDATFSNGSSTVTTPATDVPFTILDIGKVMWGSTSQSCGGNVNVPVLTMAQGTITGFNNAHSVTVSNTASGGCVGAGGDGCPFVWGTDDTTAMNNAWIAATNTCLPLIMPAGGTIIQAAPFNGSPACMQGSSPGNDSPHAQVIAGQGPYATTLLFSPSYTFAHTAFSTNIASIRYVFHDFGVASFSPNPAAGSGKTGFTISFYSWFYNTFFLDFFPSSTLAFTALSASGVGNAPAFVHDNIFVNAGTTSVSIGNAVNFYDNEIQDSNQACLQVNSGTTQNIIRDNIFTLCGVQGAILTAAGNDSFASFGNQYSSNGTTLPAAQLNGGPSAFTFCNDIINGAGTTGAGLGVGATNIVTFDCGANTVTNTGSGAAPGILNAGTVSLKNTAVSSTNGVSVSNSGTLIFNEGNSFPNGITNTGTIQIIDGAGGYEGACTGVVTSGGTIGLYGLGQTTLTTCTSATIASGRVMTKPGKVYALYCTATAGNQAADACTVVKNGAAQTMTCSLNAVTSCTDGTIAHFVTYVAGDILGIEAVGGAATTLANVKGIIVAQ